MNEGEKGTLFDRKRKQKATTGRVFLGLVGRGSQNIHFLQRKKKPRGGKRRDGGVKKPPNHEDGRPGLTKKKKKTAKAIQKDRSHRGGTTPFVSKAQRGGRVPDAVKKNRWGGGLTKTVVGSGTKPRKEKKEKPFSYI